METSYADHAFPFEDQRNLKIDALRRIPLGLRMALTPQEARRSASAAPGCPEFGEDSVFDRGPEITSPRGGSVRPGLHPAIADRPEIVWWDSGVLELDVEEQVSLRQQRMIRTTRPRPKARKPTL
jgi:hypothetical protein